MEALENLVQINKLSRNFENYRLRVLVHCGWDGVINRVR